MVALLFVVVIDCVRLCVVVVSCLLSLLCAVGVFVVVVVPVLVFVNVTAVAAAWCEVLMLVSVLLLWCRSLSVLDCCVCMLLFVV